MVMHNNILLPPPSVVNLEVYVCKKGHCFCMEFSIIVRSSSFFGIGLSSFSTLPIHSMGSVLDLTPFRKKRKMYVTHFEGRHYIH